MTESKKHLLRISANYIRLLSTLALGFVVVPLTINWLGDEAFGLISLLGANIGLASIFRQIIQQSLTRELGAAYHAGDEAFRSNYRAICLISFVCTLLSLATFALMIPALHLLKIPPSMLHAAMWFVAGQGINTAAMIFLSPMLNMYLVTERFIGYNIWFIGVRSTNIISVVVLGYAIGIKDPAIGLLLHGIVWSLLGMLGFGIAAAYIYSKDHRLMIRFRGAKRDVLRDVLKTFSWNSAVQVAMNLHEQIPPLLLNLFVGPLANAAWGIGFRFVAYIRMATTGVQFGSDAVSARMAAGDDSEVARKQLMRLINVQTKLTAMIALPAGILVFVYGWPLFHLWVGRSLRNYEQVMPTAVVMTRVLAWAIASRAISETWMIVLYGAGYVRSYAKWVIAGGIIAPVASILLMWNLPDDLVPYAPPVMLSLVFVTIHLFGFPFITGRCLQIAPLSLLAALVRPALVSVGAMACALATLHLGSDLGDLGFSGTMTAQRAAGMNWYWIVGSLAVFGFVYTIGSFMAVMTPDERKRIGRLLGKVRARTGPPA